MSGRQGRTARAGPPSVQRAPRVFPRCLVPASWGVLRTRFSLWSALPSEPGIGGEVDPVPLRERGCGNRGSPTPVSVTAPSGARSPSDRRSGDRQPAGLPEGLCVCVCAPHTGPSSGRRRRTGTDRGTPRDIRGPSEATPLESRAHVRHPRVTVGGGSVALSRGALWVVAAVSGRKVPRYGRRDGAGSATSRVCSAPGPAPPPTRPASAGPLGWNLFLSAQGRVRWLGGDSEWGSEWRLVLAQGVQAACSSTVHPPSSWTPRPWF